MDILKKITNTEETAVAAFYKFVDWDDFKGLKLSLTKVCSKAGTVGTILLAPEGINGTISGTAQSIQTVLEFLWDDQRLVDLTPKYSTATGKTFKRMKIKINKWVDAKPVLKGWEKNQIEQKRKECKIWWKEYKNKLQESIKNKITP